MKKLLQICLLGVMISLNAADDSLIAYWNFDQSDGKIAKDSSANKNNLTVHQAKLVQGYKGKAFKFEGKNSFLDCTKMKGLPGKNQNFTISGWCKPLKKNGYWQFFALLPGTTFYYGHHKGEYFLVATSAGYIETYYYPPKMKPNVWHHIAMVAYPKAKMYLFYIDGKYINKFILKEVAVSKGSTSYIGGFPDNKNQSSVIDEVRMYKRALAPEEIYQLYKYNKIKTASLTAKNALTPLIKKRSLIANYTSSPPVIDGEINDACWKKHPVKMRNLNIIGNTTIASELPVSINVAYDKDNLYMAFRCMEKKADIVANETENGGAVWGDSCVDMFFSPPVSVRLSRLPKAKRHFQLMFNSLGSTFAQIADEGAQSFGGKWIVKTKVTPNYYQAEVKIPLKELDKRLPAPQNMQMWGLQIGKLGFLGKQREIASLFPVAGQNFNEHTTFGNLVFVRAFDGPNIEREVDYQTCVRPALDKINKIIKKALPKNARKLTQIKNKFKSLWRKSRGISYVGQRDNILKQLSFTQNYEIQIKREQLANKFRKLKSKLLVMPYVTMKDKLRAMPDIVPTMNKINKPVSLRLCRNEFEPASVILWAPDTLNNVSVKMEALADKNIDIRIRWVKYWYQAGTISDTATGLANLTPELLVNDDDIVKVDFEQKINIFKEPPTDKAGLYNLANYPEDAKTLQPLKVLKAQFAKQLWLTVHAGKDAKPGKYETKINFFAAGEKVASIPVKVEVLPFKLKESKIEHNAYSHTVWGKKCGNLKTTFAPVAEIVMRDMLEHGVKHVALTEDIRSITEVVKTMKKVGFNVDTVYLQNWLIPYLVPHEHDEAGLRDKAVRMAPYVRRVGKQWIAAVKKGGAKNVYIYLIDELKGKKLLLEKPFADIIHELGAKTWVAVNCGASYFKYAGDFIDCPVMAFGLDKKLANKVRAAGKRIFSYANPQSGPEYPEMFRRNYGLLLWQNNYNGAFVWAWMWPQGRTGYKVHPWADFFPFPYFGRNYYMVYQARTGVVNTIQSEGWREAVDDCRYLATLQYWIKNAKDKTAAEKAEIWLKKLKKSHLKDLDVIRNIMIKYIMACRGE